MHSTMKQIASKSGYAGSILVRLTVLWNFPWWAWARKIKLRKSHFGLKFDGWQGAVYHEADPCMKWPHSANVAFSDIGRPRVLSEHLVPALLWQITHIGLGRFTSNCPSATELQDPTSREPTKHKPEQKWAVPLVLSLDLSRTLILISSLACTIGAQKICFAWRSSVWNVWSTVRLVCKWRRVHYSHPAAVSQPITH